MRFLGLGILGLTLSACTDATSGLDAGVPVQDSGSTDGGSVDAGLPPDSGPLIQSGLEVQTEAGLVRGSSDGSLRVFRGIPFAESTAGARRFRPPERRSPWTGTLDATELGPSCPQPKLGSELIIGDFAGPQSEDCLSLNIWAHDDGRAHPVMVFIYGGGFVVGGSAWPIYDGSELARRGDVTVVTINYRVGPLGFLAIPEQLEDSGQAGNYGILDQIAALRWVKDNITGFGGDPDRVTIFGESAGAISTCALFGAPAADGLFQQAIIESGFCTLSTADAGYLGGPTTITAGAELVEALGCADASDRLACLRGLSTEDLAQSTSIGAIFTGDVTALSAVSPYVDGRVITEQPLARLSRPAGDKPLIVGSNESEGILFAGSDIILTRTNLRDGIQKFVGSRDLADQITDLYPITDFLLPSDAWIAFLGELTFICPGLRAAEAASGGAPAYTYHFTRSPLLTRAIGAGHGIELPYVFGTFGSLGILPTAADRRVSEDVQLAWTRFATHGVPALSETWPAYSKETPKIAKIDDPVTIANRIRNGRCEELHALGVVP